jgi:hypothetical protein
MDEGRWEQQMNKKSKGVRSAGENPGLSVVEELLIKLLIALITWLLTKLSTRDGERKAHGE